MDWSFDSTDGPVESQTVTITATDEDGGITNVTFDLTVDNLDPTLTVDEASVTVDEGQPVTNSGTYGDVPADTVSVVASIGTVVFSGGLWTWSYTGADDLATTTVTITASDEDGGSAIATFDLTVNNVAPTLTVDNASVTINEGQAATNSGTYDDVPADTVSVTASIGTVVFSGGRGDGRTTARMIWPRRRHDHGERRRRRLDDRHVQPDGEQRRADADGRRCRR